MLDQDRELPITLLECKDVFAFSTNEMSNLGQTVIEHRLNVEVAHKPIF